MSPKWICAFAVCCVVISAHGQTRRAPSAVVSVPKLRSVFEVIGAEAGRLRFPSQFGYERHQGKQVIDDLAANAVRWFVRSPDDPLDAAEQRLRNRHYLKVGDLLNSVTFLGTNSERAFLYPKGGVPVRFATKDDGTALIITGLAADKVYNTLRMDTNERVAAVTRSYVLPSIEKFDGFFRSEPSLTHYGLLVVYQSKDFLAAGTDEVEMLGFVASAASCREFLNGERTDVDFVRSAEKYLLHRDATQVRRTEVNLK